MTDCIDFRAGEITPPKKLRRVMVQSKYLEIVLGFLDSPMTLQKISLSHEDLQVPIWPVHSQPPADHSERMTNHGHIYDSRENEATESWGPNMHSTL